MAKPPLLRFAVGSEEGPQSCNWRVWAYGDDVYLSTQSPKGAPPMKFSFHRSGVCHWAFDRERLPANVAANERAMMRWKRGATPPDGSGRGWLAARIHFPTDFLSTAWTPSVKPTTWLKPAPAGCTKLVDLVFARESRETIVSGFAQGAGQSRERRLLAYRQLPCGDCLVVCEFEVETGPGLGEDEPFRVTGGSGSDVVFSKHDPGPGRPIRILLPTPKAKESGVLEMCEMGGYAADPARWPPPPSPSEPPAGEAERR